MKGTGIASALEHIRKSFLGIHGDQRDREQLDASLQLEVELGEMQVATVERSALNKTEKTADELIQSAMRCPSIKKCIVRRTNVHHAWHVGDLNQQADLPALYAQALRSLENK